MRIELFDMDEFVELNHLQEITSPILFERGAVPNPNGLVSNEIFGINIKSRRETFAYIDLHGHFLHPHIYKIIKRVFRNIDKIINGEEYYSINPKTGELMKDENGDTGIEFLYDNWEKIKWVGTGGMSTERTKLIQKSKKNEVWMSKYIVIPAFYRDINSSKGGGGETHPLNNYYMRLLRMANLLAERDMFTIQFHATNYNIQNTLLDIYNYLKDRLDKKSGLLRKYLLGKNVDYCVRTVISAPTFNHNSPDDRMVDFRHCAIPINEACVLCYPFVVAWVKNFFEKELIENQYAKVSYSLDSGEEVSHISIRNPESFYSDKLIKRAIDNYVKNPSSRFDKIPVPTDDGKEHYLIFSGKSLSGDVSENSPLIKRYFTWTDLLYLATTEVTKDKHAMVTRYPILDNFGIFISRIRISSTIKTMPMEVNGQIYKWYPYVDLNMSKSEVSNFFIDTTVFSNSYLKGLDKPNRFTVEYKPLELLENIFDDTLYFKGDNLYDSKRNFKVCQKRCTNLCLQS